MRIEFHPDAFAEYQAAVAHYEDRRPGLGARFILAIEKALESIRQAPERWPILEDDVRRRLTRVFPFAVLYTIEREYILVVAIMHCHREPGYWRRRTYER